MDILKDKWKNNNKFPQMPFNVDAMIAELKLEINEKNDAPPAKDVYSICSGIERSKTIDTPSLTVGTKMDGSGDDFIRVDDGSDRFCKELD